MWSQIQHLFYERLHIWTEEKKIYPCGDAQLVLQASVTTLISTFLSDEQHITCKIFGSQPIHNTFNFGNRCSNSKTTMASWHLLALKYKVNKTSPCIFMDAMKYKKTKHGQHKMLNFTIQLWNWSHLDILVKDKNQIKPIKAWFHGLTGT